MQGLDKDNPKRWYVYLLCKIGANINDAPTQGNRDLYVGMTNGPLRRLVMHNAGQVKSTRHAQWAMVALLPCPDRTAAACIERWAKSGDTRNRRMMLFRLCPTQGGRDPNGPQAIYCKANAAMRKTGDY